MTDIWIDLGYVWGKPLTDGRFVAVAERTFGNAQLCLCDAMCVLDAW